MVLAPRTAAKVSSPLTNASLPATTLGRSSVTTADFPANARFAKSALIEESLVDGNFLFFSRVASFNSAKTAKVSGVGEYRTRFPNRLRRNNSLFTRGLQFLERFDSSIPSS